MRLFPKDIPLNNMLIFFPDFQPVKKKTEQQPAIREQKADVSKIKEARSKLSKAKKNLKRKLGAAVDAGTFT